MFEKFKLACKVAKAIKAVEKTVKQNDDLFDKVKAELGKIAASLEEIKSLLPEIKDVIDAVIGIIKELKK